MAKTTCLFAVVLMLFGCRSATERVATSTNAEVKVSVLTRFEGVTLYRVEADGKDIYVARTGAASGEALATTATWTETVCNPCGKSECCHQESREQTVIAAHPARAGGRP